jgi:purine-binding chemotaxis protein CheW
MNGGRESETFLVVRSGARLAALPVAHVVETMRALPIEPLAGMPPFVLGLSVVRGVPLPVIDARILLGSDPTAPPRRFVTLRIEGRCATFAVDEVLGVRELGSASLQELPPLLRDASAEVASLMGTLDARLLFVLRTGRILSESTPSTSALGGT